MPEAKDITIGGLALVGGVSIAKESAALAGAIIINNVSYVRGQPVVSLANIGQGELDIRIPVTILNSNIFSITIDKFLGTVAYGEIPISDILIPDQFTLVAEEAILIDLFFTLDLPELVQDVFDAFQNGGFGTILNKIYLDGNLFILGSTFIGQVKLPINTSFSILPN